MFYLIGVFKNKIYRKIAQGLELKVTHFIIYVHQSTFLATLKLWSFKFRGIYITKMLDEQKMRSLRIHKI